MAIILGSRVEENTPAGRCPATRDREVDTLNILDHKIHTYIDIARPCNRASHQTCQAILNRYPGSLPGIRLSMFRDVHVRGPNNPSRSLEGRPGSGGRKFDLHDMIATSLSRRGEIWRHSAYPTHGDGISRTTRRPRAVPMW